jgi:hypothetical protein
MTKPTTNQMISAKLPDSDSILSPFQLLFLQHTKFDPAVPGSTFGGGIGYSALDKGNDVFRVFSDGLYKLAKRFQSTL